MNTQVLYLSYDGMTDPLGQSQVIPYLIGLSSEGYKITLVSFEKKERAGSRIEIGKILKNAGIDWIPMSYTKRPPILSTIWDIFRLRNRVAQLHAERSFKLVHCRSYITSFVGLALRRKYGIPFIFDMRGFYADERVDGNIWNLKNPIYKLIFNFFKKKEKQFLSESDHVVSLTSAGKKIMEDEWGISSPITVIPCCVDTSHFTLDPEKSREARKDLGLKESDFVLSYLGSIGTWYMLPEMMDFFKVLLESKPTAKFFFITPDDPELILKEADIRGLNRDLFFIRKASRSEVPILTGLSDFSIFFIKPVFSKKASSPTKQGELMSLGIPVLCNSGVGDTDMIIEKYSSGLLVKDFNEEDYKEAIDRMAGAFQIGSLNKGAIEYFGLENGIERYLSIYADLSNESNRMLNS